jgi:hypothetical protein
MRRLVLTINVVVRACTVVPVLEVTVPGTRATYETGSYTLSIVCTCFVAALKALSVHVCEITTVVIRAALEGKGALIGTLVRATVILRAAVACGASCGATRGSWRDGLSSDNRRADYVVTGKVSLMITDLV